MNAFRLAWRSFIRRRFGLLLIVPPTAVLFALVAMYFAAERGAAFTHIDEMDRRIVRVGAYERETWFTPAQVAQISKLPHVVAAGFQSPTDCVTSEVGVNKPAICFSTTPTYLRIWRDQIIVPEEQYERWEKQRNGFIVCKQTAERHGWKVGQAITLPRMRPGSAAAPVQGVITYIAEEGLGFGDIIYVHPEYADEFDPLSRNRWVVWLVLDDAGNREAFMRDLPGKLPGTPMELSTMEDTKRLLRSTTSLLVMLFRLMGLIAFLLVIAISLTILTLSIEERRVEYATVRAIGARRNMVVNWVVIESVLLLLPGAVLGGALTYALFRGGVQINTLAFRVTWEVAASVSVLALLLGVFAALWPSMRAGDNVLEKLRGG